MGHRLGDALIRSSTLRERAKAAFEHFLDTGDATGLARLAPTSIVFGAWDSRDTQAKLPRLVQSTIRAWDVDVIKRSAQYNPPLDYSKLEVFSAEQKEKQEGNPASPVAERGFVHVPAPNTHGGVVANGPIERRITINLIALRRLQGDGQNTLSLRRYILGLALVAATEPLDGFLRQGCLLTRDPDNEPVWETVSRTGKREALVLDQDVALDYAKTAKAAFPVVDYELFQFDKKLAHADFPADVVKAVKAKGK